ncbi:hypothetical protein FF100_04625 [Methylobacterium terricola]|uniref:Uncharacterized protein n=1 Tax=Methylobacterium terricola TaxID=2583531 RepID=A0A5C4LK47_9HYPH|nr:hypothetical protein [Methylobacterium terricola]TNC14867.1 hypothetical protein FF100_04625 [Methylobacterium terricola]
MEIVIISGGIGYRKDGRWYTLTGKDAPGLPIEWPVTAWTPMLFAPDDGHPCPNRSLYDVGQCCGGHCFGVDGPDDEEPAPADGSGVSRQDPKGLDPKDDSAVDAVEAPDLKSLQDQIQSLSTALAESERRAKEAISTLSKAAAPLARIASNWDCMRSGSPGTSDNVTVPVYLGQLRALDRALSSTPTQETSRVEG